MRKFQFILLAAFFVCLAWVYQPTPSTFKQDAGWVAPVSDGGVWTSSSNAEELDKVHDHNTQNHWQSEAPLPQRVFLKNYPSIPVSTITKTKYPASFDYDLATATQLKGSIQIPIEKSIALVSFKIGFEGAMTLQWLSTNNEAITTSSISLKSNYDVTTLTVPKGATMAILEGASPWQLFEWVQLADFPQEWVQVDLGKVKEVGAIRIRHWAGDKNVRSSTLVYSQNGKEWKTYANLPINDTQVSLLTLDSPVLARYVRLIHSLLPSPWNKALVWELSVYDADGPYGKMPIDKPNGTQINDFLGVNGVWGWAHNEYSSNLNAQQGPELFRQVAGHFRNYHDLTWDINKPSDAIDFVGMAAGKGTTAKTWLNWHQEYDAWHKKGQDIQASIQFFRFPDSAWNQPRKEAYNYGAAFAKSFGLQKNGGTICTMEVGNEPWAYDAGVYQEILVGMASGAKSANTDIEVFPCALQAAWPDNEQTQDFKNYMGARISKEAIPFLDGINVHCYSYRKNTMGQEIATYPEHPSSTFKELRNAIRWRDANMPGKKIYLSEYGWDCSSEGQDCAFAKCVSEQAAAAYGIRAAVIALRMGVERATWFFHSDTEEGNGVFTRSGMIQSPKTGQKKRPFQAFALLKSVAGTAHFQKVIQENEQGVIYQFSDLHGVPTHWIAWKPVDISDTSTKMVQLPMPKNSKLRAAYWMDGRQEAGIGSDNPVLKWKPSQIELELSSVPMLISFK